MPRERVLSDEGLRLFNIGCNSPPKLGCLRSLLHNLFTSDFDVKLEENCKQMRKSSCKLYSFLTSKKRDAIPPMINNAITNIILLVLLTDNKINTLQRVKYSVHYYTYLAEKAHKEGDHHTAILIMGALQNTVIRRLKLKSSKREKEILKKLEKDYGTFMDCHSQHLRSILATKDGDLYTFLPSIMILLMHLNKTKEYTKGFKAIGKMSGRLEHVQYQLTQIVDDYYQAYRHFQKDMLKLYMDDPMANLVMIQQPSKSIVGKLHDISQKILADTSYLKRTKAKRRLST